MDDPQIIELYWARSERAISETKSKYGRFCRSIAFRILRNTEDTDECENDTYFHAWNAMPPQRPSFFSAFLGKITRNLSLDRYEKRRAEKRGGGEIPVLLEELEECIADPDSAYFTGEQADLARVLNCFIAELSEGSRRFFLRRYWYGDSTRRIAEDCGVKESRVKMSLMRLRARLRERLEAEEIAV